ncbi:MAG: tetratricopeptide repeat protein [bacterium]
MRRFFALFVLLCYMIIPILGLSQTNNPKPTGNKKTTVIPVTLSPDSSSKNNGNVKTKNPQQVVLKKPGDSIKMKAREYFMSAGKKAESKDYKGAIKDYRKSLSYNKSAITYTKLAYAYLLSQEYDSAIVASKEGMKMLPKNFEACTILGVAYYEKQNFDDAFNTFQKACGLNPTNPDPMVHNYMAAIKFLKKDYKSAVIYYDSVVMKDSSYQDVFTNRGMMQHYLGNFKDAINDYSTAIKIDSTDANACNNRAAARIVLKEFPLALEDLDHAIRLNPGYANAYENRGKVKLQLGDKVGACTDWTKSLSMGLETSKELIIRNCK